MAFWKYTTVAPSLDGFVTQPELESGLMATLLAAYNNVATALGLGTLTAIPTNGSVTAASLSALFSLAQTQVTGLTTSLANAVIDAYNEVASDLGLGLLTAIPTNGSVTNTSLSSLFSLAQSQVGGLATSLSNATVSAINNITSALNGGSLTAIPTNNSVSLASLIGGFVLPQSNVGNLLADLTAQINYTKVVRDALATSYNNPITNATDAQVISGAQYVGAIEVYAQYKRNTALTTSFTTTVEYVQWDGFGVHISNPAGVWVTPTNLAGINDNIPLPDLLATYRITANIVVTNASLVTATSVEMWPTINFFNGFTLLGRRPDTTSGFRVQCVRNISANGRDTLMVSTIIRPSAYFGVGPIINPTSIGLAVAMVRGSAGGSSVQQVADADVIIERMP